MSCTKERLLEKLKEHLDKVDEDDDMQFYISQEHSTVIKMERECDFLLHLLCKIEVARENGDNFFEVKVFSPMESGLYDDALELNKIT